MKLKRFVAVSISSIMLTACAADGTSAIKKEHSGGLGGAVAGAWAGSNVGKGKGNIAAIAAGTLLGAYLGKEIGASLDRADMAYYNKTSQYSLESAPTGTTSTWRNPDSGNSGTFTPTQTYKTAQGAYCREYNQTISVGGKVEQAYGTACRQEDGSWQSQN
jgi:surface antigen